MRRDDFEDRPMIPWSEAAEVAVLGALLVDNAVWDAVGDTLTEASFYSSVHGRIFGAIGVMVVAGNPADVITVFEELQRQGEDEAVGGLPYLNSLAHQSVGARNARRYAEIIAEKAQERRLLAAAASIQGLAGESGLTTAERIDRSQQLLQDLQVTSTRSMPTAIYEGAVGLLDRIQSIADGTAPAGIPTGIPGLDRMIGGGLKGGKQVILAARPSIGKSSFAQQIALNLAHHSGVPAAILSQEMTKSDLTDRAVANLGRVELDRLISGDLRDDDWGRLSEGVEKLRALPLYLDDQPALTLADIAAKARMLKRQHGVKLIVLDYLQLCAGAADKDNRHHQIEQLSRGTKTLAKQLDLTFLILSQLNREVEKRTSGRPVLSDLKESGSIEEDADIVMLLSRAQKDANGIQIITCDIPKNRQGRVGEIALAFDGPHQTWLETFVTPQTKQPARKHYTEDV